MRDLLFKNLTSNDRKRKILASSEVTDKQGVRSTVRRHFAYIIREVKKGEIEKSVPYLYVFKKRDTEAQKEKFFCRIKGSLYVAKKQGFYLILYMHSLKINLEAIPNSFAESNG